MRRHMSNISMTSVTSAGSGTLSSSPSYRLLNAQISPLATALEMNSRSNCLLPTGLARSHSISICSFSAAVKDISNTWDSIAFRTSCVRCKLYRSGRRLARAKRQDGRSSAARLAHARRPIFARCRAQSIQANSVEYSAICLTTRCLRRGPRRPDRLAGAAGARGRRSPLSPAAAQQKTQQFLAIGAKLCSSFVLILLAKENAAPCPLVSKPLSQPRPPIRQRTCAPRALLKFEREQLIVDVLNRGVSLAEIAARVGLSEKRMRAIICDPPDWDPGLAPCRIRPSRSQRSRSAVSTRRRSSRSR